MGYKKNAVTKLKEIRKDSISYELKYKTEKEVFSLFKRKLKKMRMSDY